MNIYSRTSLVLFALVSSLSFTNSLTSPPDASNFDLYCIRTLRKTFDTYSHPILISREEANNLILNKKNELLEKTDHQKHDFSDCVRRINKIAAHYLNCPTENIIDLVIGQKKSDFLSHFRVDVKKNFAKNQTVDDYSLKKIISKYNKKINEIIDAINLEKYQNIYQYDRQYIHEEFEEIPHIKLRSPDEYKNLYQKGMKKIIKSETLYSWFCKKFDDKNDFFALLCKTLTTL